MVAIAAVTLILSTATFLRSYRQAIVEGARTSSSQAVSQVVGSVGNYVDNIDEIMDLVMDSMNQSPEERNALLDALQTTRSEVIAITTYDADGVLQGLLGQGPHPTPEHPAQQFLRPGYG